VIIRNAIDAMLARENTRQAERNAFSSPPLVAAVLGAAVMGALKPASPRSRSPHQRGKGKRSQKHLIDARYRATTVATYFNADSIVVRRDGRVTHLIYRSGYGDGWAVARVKPHPSSDPNLFVFANGRSNWYPEPRQAAAQYALVVDKWGAAS
jgi:hypothetical protein